MKKLTVPYVEQKRPNYCGPACLKMVLNYFGIDAKQDEIAEFASLGHEEALENSAMAQILRAYGFKAEEFENASIANIKKYIDNKIPVIVNFIEPDENKGHYAVITGYGKGKLIMNDPWNGENFRMKEEEFQKRWYAGYESKRHWILVIHK